MKILNKYVLKEHAGPLTFAAAALTSLLLLNYIAKNIGQLVGKGLPWTVIAEFIGLSVPFTVAMTLPMAVLVGVLYAFSRLAAENEITALKASGVSLSRVLVPVVIGATGITIAMILFNDQVLPRANHRLRTLQGDIARKKPTFALRARVLNEVSPGKLFLIANHLDAGTNRMKEVVIYDLGDPVKERTIYADSGLMAMIAETGDLEMTLFDGNMEEVKKAEPSELQRLFYKVDIIRVRGVGDQLTRSQHDDYKSEREMTICEMQANVADGARSRSIAKTSARDALLNGVRTAVTGSVPPPPVTARPVYSASTGAAAPPPPGADPIRTPFGLGRVYCDGEAAFLAFVERHRPAKPLPPKVAIGALPRTADSAHAVAVPIGAHPPGTPPAVVPPGPHPPVTIAGHSAPATPAKVSDDDMPKPARSPVHPPIPAAAGHQAPIPAAAGHSAAPIRPPFTNRLPPGAQHPVPPTHPLFKPQPGQPVQGQPGKPGLLGRPGVPGQPGVLGQPAVPGQPIPPPPQRFYPPSQAVMTLTSLTGSVEAASLRQDEGQRNVDLYDVEIQKKFAIAVACVIFVFLGAPIALRFPRGGVGMVLGVSLGVFALYYIGLIAGEPLGQRHTVPPFLAMWSSNIIFSIVGALLMLRIGRESSTSRGGDMGELLDKLRRWLAMKTRGRKIPILGRAISRSA